MDPLNLQTVCDNRLSKEACLLIGLQPFFGSGRARRAGGSAVRIADGGERLHQMREIFAVGSSQMFTPSSTLLF